MKPRTAAELAIACATGLIALGMVLYGLHDAKGKTVVGVVAFLAIGAGMIAFSWHLGARRIEPLLAAPAETKIRMKLHGLIILKVESIDIYKN